MKQAFRFFFILWIGLGLMITLLPTPCPAQSQDEETENTEEQKGELTEEEKMAALAKQSQNPIANLISVPFQNNTSFGIGEYDRTQNVLNIQPVVPFSGEHVRLITRTIIPVIYQPDVDQQEGGTNGLSDINATFFFSPAKTGRVTWGAGPILVFPSATDDATGSGKWAAGPSAVALVMPGPWVIGGLVNNVWSFAGDSEREDVNRFLFQYFINYNFPSRWYISSAPIITANWKAPSGNRWIVPFGGGVGKVFAIGRQRFNASFQVFGNAVTPDGGPTWSIRAQLVLLFPK